MSFVFSICQRGNSWLWAAWESKDNAYDFLHKTDKVIEFDCLFWSFAGSENDALQSARKLLGNSALRFDSDFAIAVGKTLYDLPKQNSSEAIAGATKEFTPSESKTNPLELLDSLTGLDAVKTTVKELVNIARLAILSQPSAEDLKTLIATDIPDRQQLM